MEECKKEGLAKSIGVSNFGVEHLQEILEDAEFPPAVNQVSRMQQTYQWYCFLRYPSERSRSIRMCGGPCSP
jgi:diketogulonate reductase-like aldo/keto reductase